PSCECAGGGRGAFGSGLPEVTAPCLRSPGGRGFRRSYEGWGWESGGSRLPPLLQGLGLGIGGARLPPLLQGVGAQAASETEKVSVATTPFSSPGTTRTSQPYSLHRRRTIDRPMPPPSECSAWVPR